MLQNVQHTHTLLSAIIDLLQPFLNPIGIDRSCVGQSCGWLVLQGIASPARCIQDSSGNLAILQSCGRLVLQGIASPARCIQDSPGNLAILQSCGWSVPQCKLRKLAFLMMMKEQSCKLFGRCVWFPVISGGQPPPPEPTTLGGGGGLTPVFDRKLKHSLGNKHISCQKLFPDFVPFLGNHLAQMPKMRVLAIRIYANRALLIHAIMKCNNPQRDSDMFYQYRLPPLHGQ